MFRERFVGLKGLKLLSCGNCERAMMVVVFSIRGPLTWVPAAGLELL